MTYGTIVGASTLLAHAEVVFKYLLKIGATKEDAEDVVQEAIMKTIECLQQIKANKLRAWLFKVALHRYYTLYNKQKTQTIFTDSELEQFKSAIHVEEQLIIYRARCKFARSIAGTSAKFPTAPHHEIFYGIVL